VIRNFILLIVLAISAQARAQYIPLSENAEVSILTIGPGTDLNDAFGHNGFRIKDVKNQIDIVYDYGRYDFNTPHFYLKFARGQLLYELGAANFEAFFGYYMSQNRWVKEQTLNLTYSEKQALFSFLQENAKPENKKYKYDFFYDNCATKIRDVLIEVLGDKLEYKEDHITENYTFRQLIQKNVDANSWGSLGMDVAIGAVVDRKAKPIEYQFLPEYINKGAQNAIIKRDAGTEPLVKESKELFIARKTEVSNNFFMSPLFIFGCLGLLILYVTYRDFKRSTRSRMTDALIFFITGVLGVFLLLLWFATDHTATANNYNLLWAVPLSLMFFGSINRKTPKNWIKKYVFFLILLMVLLTIHWITGVQEFATGLLPILLALTVRYMYLRWYLSSTNQSNVSEEF
jgi:hypothetical protein